VAGRRRVDSEQLAGMDEDDGLHLCENKTKGYWAVIWAWSLDCCWATPGLRWPVLVSPPPLFISFSLFYFYFLFSFPILYSAFNSDFNCRFLTLLIPLSCIAVIIKPFFPFGTSILYLNYITYLCFIQNST
jgi:hypothetical protein